MRTTKTRLSEIVHPADFRPFQVGDIVQTNYGTGPYRILKIFSKKRNGETLLSFALCDADKPKAKVPDSWLNDYVYRDGECVKATGPYTKGQSGWHENDNGLDKILRVPPHPSTTSTVTPSGIMANDTESIPPLTIDPEIRDLIPPLSKQERQELEKSLRTEGCLDRLKGWAQTGILLDGHNRKEICDAAGIKYDVEWLTFSGRPEAIDFVLGLQLARRNVSDEQKIYLIGKRLENEKLTQGGDRKSSYQVDNLKNGKAPKGKTADRIARESNVSPASVNRAGVKSKAIDRLGAEGGESLKRALKDGTVKMSNGAAQAVAKLPAAKLRETAERIKNGVTNVDSALPASARPAPAAARETKRAKPETERGIGETEFRETVLRRLNELGELIAATPALRVRTGKVTLVVKRLAELTTFVEAWQ